MYNIYNKDTHSINQAPHWKLLSCFGGNKSIEEFRNHFNTHSYTNIDNYITSLPFFFCLLFIGALSISNCLTLIAAIAHQVKNNSALISVLSFPVIIPIFLLLIKLSKISSAEFSWILIEDDIYLLILLNIILVSLTKVLFGFLWRN